MPNFIGATPTREAFGKIRLPSTRSLRAESGFATKSCRRGRGSGRALRLGLALVAAALVVACGVDDGVVAGADARARPNIVFLLSDDQSIGTMGHEGQPWMQTPGMDRLAAEGARFTRAFVTTSLCSPSRATFLSGRWARSHQVLDNRSGLPSDLPTFASVLRAAGYDTAYVGKWHMGQQRDRPGFDYSASYIAHGRYQDAVFELNGEPVKTKGWVDDVATDHALEYLREERDAPFLLVVGFKSPHGPREPAERLLGLYEGARLAPPPNVAAIPPYPRTKELDKLVENGLERTPYSVPEDWVGLLGEARDQRRLREGANWLKSHRRAYHQLIAGADENVVRILDLIDELGLTENTIVVYASDNGICDGAHGIVIKRAAYEESIRVPLLVRYPPLVRPGTSIDELALNVDLAPTLLELAGVETPDVMQGRSLVPLLEGHEAEWRTSFVYENFYEPPFPTPTLYAIRTEAWKLVEYPGFPGWTELFHLAEDPYETENLAGSEEHAATLAALRAELTEREREIGPRPRGFE
ncbi:MAG: sulfatase [Myxococcales bacterium]|nr:sulfatase [Myxococcales bacterium]